MRAWKPKLLIPFFCPQSDEAQVTIKWLWLGKKNNLVLGLISNIKYYAKCVIAIFSVIEIIHNSSNFKYEVACAFFHKMKGNACIGYEYPYRISANSFLEA